MKPKTKPKNEGPLSIPLPFDEAMRRALEVKPPPEGWPEYERRLAAKRRRSKRREPAKVP